MAMCSSTISRRSIQVGTYIRKQPGKGFQTSAGTASGTLVATGTGSGKTECFLYPVLDHCARSTTSAGRRRHQGAGDLPDECAGYRPGSALCPNHRAVRLVFKGLRVGLFVGGGVLTRTAGALMTMSATSVITDRATLCAKTRPMSCSPTTRCSTICSFAPKTGSSGRKTNQRTLRYVVVDELHTFDGAQGTDLALLLRRLRARLQTPEGYLICDGTSSVTLGWQRGHRSTARIRPSGLWRSVSTRILRSLRKIDWMRRHSWATPRSNTSFIQAAGSRDGAGPRAVPLAAGGGGSVVHAVLSFGPWIQPAAMRMTWPGAVAPA